MQCRILVYRALFCDDARVTATVEPNLSGGVQFGSVGVVTVAVPPVACLVGILVAVRRHEGGVYLTPSSY